VTKLKRFPATMALRDDVFVTFVLCCRSSGRNAVENLSLRGLVTTDSFLSRFETLTIAFLARGFVFRFALHEQITHRGNHRRRSRLLICACALERNVTKSVARVRRESASLRFLDLNDDAPSVGFGCRHVTHLLGVSSHGLVNRRDVMQIGLNRVRALTSLHSHVLLELRFMKTRNSSAQAEFYMRVMTVVNGCTSTI
jgi:hypothetical protein